MKYDYRVGLVKAVKYFVIFLAPVLVDRFIVAFPELAQLSVGGLLVFVLNLLKIRYGVKLP